MTIAGVAQSSAPGARVELYDIDVAGDGTGDMFHFVPDVEQTTGEIVWRGVTYSPLPIEVTGFEVTGAGRFPRPRMRISNVLGAVSSLTQTYDDLRGAKVTRWVTYSQYLDGAAEADPDAHYPVEVYYVDRLIQQTHMVGEWELASILDQTDATLPRRRVLRNACSLRYRRYDADAGQFDYTGVTCPYQGTKHFTAADVPTTAANDVCSFTLQGCKLRFNTYDGGGNLTARGDLPFGGFPMVGRVR